MMFIVTFAGSLRTGNHPLNGSLVNAGAPESKFDFVGVFQISSNRRHQKPLSIFYSAAANYKYCFCFASFCFQGAPELTYAMSKMYVQSES